MASAVVDKAVVDVVGIRAVVTTVEAVLGVVGGGGAEAAVVEIANNYG